MAGSVYWEDLSPRFAAISNRLGAIEAHLAVLSEQLGVPYTPPTSGVPPTVIALVKQGKTLEAIKEYRSLTNASYDEAKAAIAQV